MTTDLSAAHPALTTLSEEESAFRDAVAAFAEEEVRPRVQEMERAARIDPDARSRNVRSRAHGHRGAGAVRRRGRLAHDGDARGGGDQPRRCVGRDHGRRAEHARELSDLRATAPMRSARSYLPRSRRKTIGAYALSEAGSGSDAFGLATRAEKQRRRLVAHRTEALDHERRRGGDLRRVRERESGGRLQGNHGVHRRARHRRDSRSERRRTSSASARRARRSCSSTGAWSRRERARRGRAGLQDRDRDAERRADRHRRADDRRRARRARCDARVREGAQAVRQAARRLSGHPVPARAGGDGARGRAAARLQRGAAQGRRRSRSRARRRWRSCSRRRCASA